MPMGGSMHLMSGIMQKLNMSTGSQSSVLILKAIKSAEVSVLKIVKGLVDLEYRY